MTTNEIIQSCLTEESARTGRGQNIIPPPEKRPLWRQYLDKFRDPLIIVLLVVFVFSVGVSVYELLHVEGKTASVLFEPIGVLLALLLATGVGFVFEVKAGREFDVLNRVKDSRPVKVYRRKQRADGQEAEPQLCMVRKQDICVGDIVRLESGDEIPADGTLLESNQLRVDESNFTGELYANKSADPAHADPDATYPTDFLLRGATVIEGAGLMRVTAIGMQTEEGQGVAKTREENHMQTPLNRQLDQLGRMLSKTSFIVGALIIVGRMLYFFLDGNVQNDPKGGIEVVAFALESVMLAVTLIVVAVPEGLPLSVTMSLALSMRKMLRQNNLVRRLHACETMGAATIICTDKTGTLTRNQMTVMETDFPDDADELLRIRTNMAVNSTAEVQRNEDGTLESIGNPTEVALLKWMIHAGTDYRAMRQEATVLAQEPFSTELKYMVTTAQLPQFERPIRLIKGAPEIVLAMADQLAGAQTREHYAERLQLFQQQAMRTLAFAWQWADGDADANPIVFSGIVGITDPVRDDVPAAIDTCMNHAGVRVIIVTGDTPGTAREIGRQIGLIQEGDDSLTITGTAFAELDDDAALELVGDPKLKIISRARPNDKARLVSLLQQRGEVVAVTGDGTNDAPALSQAQVGLSMGDGTARAKEASDITIIDNSFVSINKAIMWGRSLYLNIRRFILFQMTINVCACLIVLFGACSGLDSPLTVTQMLWVNLIMDTFAAMALSSLPADKSVLESKPRSRTDHIINRPMARTMLTYGLVFSVALILFWQLLWQKDFTSMQQFVCSLSDINVKELFSLSHSKAHLSTYELGLFFSTFVLMQFWNLFNAKYFCTGRSLIADINDHLHRHGHPFRTFYSRGFIGVVVAILIGQVFIVNFADRMFNVSPLHASDWLWIILLTSPVLILPDILRTIRRRRCA